MVRPSKFVRPSASAGGRGETCARTTVAARSKGGSNNASERTHHNNNAPSGGFRSERETTSGVAVSIAVTLAVTIVDEAPPSLVR